MFLTAAVAVASYATKADIARGYVVIALPCVTLRREPHHGLLVTAACVVDSDEATVIADIPALGGIDNIVEVVRGCHADTVAVLACPEMSGYRLRKLAWELEKTGTDLCVAPALLDVAGPRTTIRPVAGLPLLHLDHPEFTGARLVIKGPVRQDGGDCRANPHLAAVCGTRAGHPAGRRRSRAVQADQGGQGRQDVHGLQVPHHGDRRRAA